LINTAIKYAHRERSGLVDQDERPQARLLFDSRAW
jgi:hypothetical protein